MTASPRVGLRWTALLLVGFAVLQAVWITVVPPFRGLDEWDHAFRAGAVADGQWQATPSSATRGTGALVSAPEALVEAARPECERLPYTHAAECTGTALPDGHRAVASGAGRYNPVFYAIIGTAALPFDGVGALYAMRTAGALCCLGLLALALAAVRRWPPSPVAPAVLAVALTPTALYSSVVAAPNGVEMMAGLAWGCALIGLAREPDDGRDGLLVAVAATAGAVLMTVRSLGPLWLVLILVVLLVALPSLVGRGRRLLRTPGGLVGTGVLALAGLASVSWTLSQSALTIGSSQETSDATWGEAFTKSAELLILYPLQSIANFPYRDQFSPLFVYPLYLALGLIALVGGYLRGSRTHQRGLLLGVLLSFAVPFVVTFATWRTYGHSWQGRYGMPLGLAVMALAGLAWQSRFRPAWPALAVVGGLVWVLVQVVGPLGVLRLEEGVSPMAGAGWWLPSEAVTIGVATGGALLMWTAALAWGRSVDRADGY